MPPDEQPPETPCVLCGADATDSSYLDSTGDPICDPCGSTLAARERARLMAGAKGTD